jgi:mono/diheme cytochrome c family protein
LSPGVGLVLAIGSLAGLVLGGGCGTTRDIGGGPPAAARPASAETGDLEGHEGPAPGGLSLEAAREAYRRSELHRHLQFLEVARPGNLLRSTAAMVPEERIDRGEIAPEDLQEVGRLIFEHEYGFADGLGNGASRSDPARSPFRRVQAGRFGGPDTTGCASCHWRGGEAGAGGLPDQGFFLGDGDRIDTADGRNPPALQGVGVAQALAREMSADLQAIRTALEAEVRRTGRDAEADLVSKGIQFGTLRVLADGTVDTAGLDGVDADLVIKPFGWKGNRATLREFLAESLQNHLGIQCEDLVAGHRRKPDPDLLGAGPDPDDPDGDGVTGELTAGQLTALEAFLALGELPVIRPPAPLQGFKPAAPGMLAPTPTLLLDSWTQGRQLFREIGCAGCHAPMLVLKDPVFRTRSETTGREIEIDLSRHGDRPRLRYDPALEGYPVWLFSDLKRHDLGEENAARHVERGVAPQVYLTRRLWGLADSPPYMYDGRAPWFDQAIAAHGGEASLSSFAFDALTSEDKAALRVYLLSLRRERRFVVP